MEPFLRKRGVHEDTLKVLRSEGILFDLVDNNMLKYTCSLIEMKVNKKIEVVSRCYKPCICDEADPG